LGGKVGHFKKEKVKKSHFFQKMAIFWIFLPQDFNLILKKSDFFKKIILLTSQKKT